jgi:hypothetical protein
MSIRVTAVEIAASAFGLLAMTFCFRYPIADFAGTSTLGTGFAGTKRAQGRF